ncbi:MAG: hypothetical protein A2902_02880 [Elusimicrobia bacterium RIFCSPLOWO2_01_FULL_64_13]|nr:MAG: hypothetical protein A2636_05080 [Elusimicrobia bacterium RIFCSPHIGHO2_01_FULL_64_10]OGR95666.1 MAG: hypothetical protein A2902_02880 [Elusimicrobia bacterium RIFCSPLOWO2_01_FULL_64_13]
MRTDPHAVFSQLLESRDLKCTRQRREILDYLLRAEKHVTAEEIYRDLGRRDSALGRATVFRTLRLLEDAGFANGITFADGRKAYEHKFSRPHHDHMICVDCREVIEFSNPVIERLQDSAAREAGFEPLWHRHEIFGRCRKCARRAPVRKRGNK